MPPSPISNQRMTHTELDKLKEKGDYQGLLTLAKEYYDGNGMDEEQTYRKPCQNRGDDLLIEDKDFAVYIMAVSVHIRGVPKAYGTGDTGPYHSLWHRTCQ